MKRIQLVRCDVQSAWYSLLGTRSLRVQLFLSSHE